MKDNIELGDQVKCQVTGFKGTATARIEHLNGCVQYAVKAPMKKGENKMPDSTMIDAEQLETVKKPKKPFKKNPTGGDYSIKV